jgi:RNA polymerase sigma factor (TIGR02999 family)
MVWRACGFVAAPVAQRLQIGDNSPSITDYCLSGKSFFQRLNCAPVLCGGFQSPPQRPERGSLSMDARIIRVLYPSKYIQNRGEIFVDQTFSPIASTASVQQSRATDSLFSSLYSELHRLAKRQLARQWSPASIGVTTLLHEAYLNIMDRNQPSFPDQARFMGYAARVMRGLIIDFARTRNASKRGGKFEITSITLDTPENIVDARELSSVSDALDELAKIEPDLATLVDLRFFCGFSFVEIAAMHTLSERTVQRRWEKARIFLYRSLNGGLPA